MIRRCRQLAAGWLLCLLAACGPRTVEVEGLLELTQEIRSQRAALASSRQGPVGASAGEQIQGALSPLRDALTKLTDNQRELAARQTTLTQEMQRWTQLLAESMQAKQRAGTQAMAERLAQLEATLAAQDARHREVEQMLAAALDKTAEQLEDFLRRVGADVPAIEADSQTPAAGSPAGSPPSAGPPADPSARNAASGDAGGGSGAATPPADAGPPADPQRAAGSPGGFVPAVALGRRAAASDAAASDAAAGVDAAPRAPAAVEPSPSVGRSSGTKTRWIWWLATCLSVVAGAGLAISSLVRRITRRPARLAPPANGPQLGPENESASRPANALAGSLAHVADGEIDPGEPQHGSVEAIAPMPMPEAEAPAAAASAAPAMPWPSAPHPASQPGDVLAPFADALADLSNVGDPADPRLPEAEELWATAALLGEAIGKLKDSQPGSHDQGSAEADSDSGELPDGPAAAAMPDPAPNQTPTSEFELDEVFIIEDEEESASEPLVECRLFVRADTEGAARIRRVLGSDPRVLANPAPQVSRAGGEAEISFAVLPGLPAGERSVLEQKLRDTVA